MSMKNSDKYLQYSVQDFVLDTDFLRYVKEQAPRDQIFWKSWLGHHPHMTPVFNEALTLARMMGSFRSDAIDYNANWKNISNRHKEILQRQKWEAKYKKWQYGFIGTTTILALIIGLILYKSQEKAYKKTVITTPVDHIAHVTLPDGSDLTINKNSTIELPEGTVFGNQRRLYLDGEMYIHVNPAMSLGRRQNFEVVTRHLTVDVVGTSFNISSSDSLTQIYLEEGKIIIKEMKDIPTLTMKPGDFVSVNQRSGTVTRTKLAHPYPVYWKNKDVSFELSPVKEVLEYLEYKTMLPVQNKAEKLADKKFTGIFPSDKTHLLIKALEEAFDITVKIEKNYISVKDK